jgi:hypothetical protein
MNNGGGVVAPAGSGRARVRFVPRSAAQVEDWSPWKGLVFGCFEDGVRVLPWEQMTGDVQLQRMAINGAQCAEVWHRCVELGSVKGYGTVRGWWRRVSGWGGEGRMTSGEFIEATLPGQMAGDGARSAEPTAPGLYLGTSEGRVFWVFWVG